LEVTTFLCMYLPWSLDKSGWFRPLFH
jgi:hypothetical protein